MEVRSSKPAELSHASVSTLSMNGGPCSKVCKSLSLFLWVEYFCGEIEESGSRLF